MIESLNLDKGFAPIGSGLQFEMLQFNGGEMHIKLNNEDDYSNIEKVVITNRFRGGDDIMKVLIAKEALQRKGVKHFDLVMPYVSYARQDRQCCDGESFTLKVFTDIINSAKFENVFVLDAHSDVAPALLNNCTNLQIDKYVEWTCLEIGSHDDADITLISPDAGANKKSNKLFENVGMFSGLIKCDKRRNVKNGKIEGVEIFAGNLKDKCCLIVDDICDGGRTFIEIAKELRKRGVGNIYLFVTHGIFSKRFDELSKYFEAIYCTNSFKDIDNSLVSQFKIEL